LSRAAEQEDANAGILLRPLERGFQLDDGAVIERIALVRAVQRDPRHAVRGFVQDPVEIAHSPESRALSIPAGTVSSMRSIAVEKVLPCASVMSGTVPPPSSAPCNRKLSALRFGSSYRSTSPLIISAKCSRTRSAVRSFSSSG